MDGSAGVMMRPFCFGCVRDGMSGASWIRCDEGPILAGAPDDLLQKSDRELLAALGLLRNGLLRRAGILLVDTADVIRERVHRKAHRAA